MGSAEVVLKAGRGEGDENKESTWCSFMGIPGRKMRERKWWRTW